MSANRLGSGAHRLWLPPLHERRRVFASRSRRDGVSGAAAVLSRMRCVRRGDKLNCHKFTEEQDERQGPGRIRRQQHGALRHAGPRQRPRNVGQTLPIAEGVH
jgi:hypothetical protein